MNKTMEPKLGAPQTCPKCGGQNESGRRLPEDCRWCNATWPEVEEPLKGGILTISSEPFDRELWLQRWDTWREYVENGGGGSWPRDAFESLLDYIEELEHEAQNDA